MTMQKSIIALLVCSIVLTLGGIAPAHALPQRGEIAFYRLRAELVSSSDWLWLAFDNPNAVLAISATQTNDNPADIGAIPNGTWINQEPEPTEAGVEITVSVEFLWDANAIYEPLRLRLHKGNLGRFALNLYLDGDNEPLAQINYEGEVSEEGLPLTLGLSRLETQPSDSGSAPVREVEPRVWAMYYPWPEELDFPDTPLIPTDDKAGNLTTHVDHAQEAGLNGFIVSWWGPDSTRGPDVYGDRVIDTLLNVGADRDFGVIIELSIMDERGVRSAEDLKQALRYAIETFGARPNFGRVDGRPVIAISESYRLPPEDWATIFADLRAEGYDAFYLSFGYWNARALSVFDGVYDPGGTLFQDPPDFALHINAVRRMPLLLGTDAPPLVTVTISPGHDNSLLAARDGYDPTVIDRSDGATYVESWALAQSVQPDWLIVMGWNSWYNGTQIEPTLHYGGRYLSLTASLASVFRGERDVLWTGDSWEADYWEDTNGDLVINDGDPVLVEDVAEVDFNWGEQGPGALTDFFLARYERLFMVERDGAFVVVDTWSDDGVRVWLDPDTDHEQLLIDAWDVRGMSDIPDHAISAPLPAGEHTLWVEYFELDGEAAVRAHVAVIE